MSNYNKQKLIANLNEVYDIHVLGLASATFLISDKGRELLKTHNMMYYGQVHFLKNLADELNTDSVQRIHRTTKLISSSKMFFLTEPINMLNEFCKLNKITRPFNHDWYKFGNSVRNFLTHGGLDYEKNYKPFNIIFPISWKGNVITKDEVKSGKLDLSKFSNTYPLDLYHEIMNFAENLPDTP